MEESVLDEGMNLQNLLPAIRLTRLPSALLRFPPSSEPQTLPPPPNDPNFAHPFSISTEWYNALLNPYVPITIAIVYATTVSLVNSINARRKWRPWAFSQTAIFRLIVILHNTILAVYSAWTFLGMLNALRLAIPNPTEHYGLTGVVDALCKIQGPRGMGSAATYNEQSRAWTMTNRAFHLAADGLGPDRSDVGRMWNEGLAFYGWLFYLSKFYEVIDTAIILAKGKKSSFLQTYHHAGAMLCMWAGIRYMSPPIWMFVFVNSFIHALMYTFYLCSALKIHVPKRLKRLLTTMQITQFVVGASYAFLHLFIKYQIPVSVPYLHHVAPKIVSMAASDASSVASAAASVTLGSGAFWKKVALRAAGYEGLAENVGVSRPIVTGGATPSSVPQQYLQNAEERYRDELQWVHCLDTSGQVFGILLNCLYLAPLTWLFARFFVKSYLTQLERRRSSTGSEKVNITKSLEDATKGTSRRLSEAMMEMHPTGDSSENDSPIVESGESLNTLKSKAATAAKDTSKAAKKIQQKAQQAVDSAKNSGKDVTEKAAKVKEEVEKKSSPVAEDISKKAKNAAANVKEEVEGKSSPVAEDISKKAKDAAATLDKKSSEAGSSAKKESATKQEEVQESSAKVTDDKSFADAVKEEPESESTGDDQPTQNSPNGDGTGAGEGAGSQNTTEETAKKEEEKIIAESKPIREDEVHTGNGHGETQSNGNQSPSSNIPRPKKNKKKA